MPFDYKSRHWIPFLVLLAACSSDSSKRHPTPTVAPSNTPVPTTVLPTTAPPTRTASATPTLTSGLLYRLSEASTVLYAPPGAGAPISESLSGDFTVHDSLPEPPNVFYALTIDAIDLKAKSVTIEGGSQSNVGCALDPGLGCIQELTIGSPPTALALAHVVANDEPIVLSGQGAGTGVVGPPVLLRLKLCGGFEQRAASCEDIETGAAPGVVLNLIADLWNKVAELQVSESSGGSAIRYAESHALRDLPVTAPNSLLEAPEITTSRADALTSLVGGAASVTITTSGTIAERNLRVVRMSW